MQETEKSPLLLFPALLLPLPRLLPLSLLFLHLLPSLLLTGWQREALLEFNSLEGAAGATPVEDRETFPQLSVPEGSSPQRPSSWVSCSDLSQAQSGKCLAWGGGGGGWSSFRTPIWKLGDCTPETFCFCCPIWSPCFQWAGPNAPSPESFCLLQSRFQNMLKRILILLESDVKIIFRFSCERKSVVCLHLNPLTEKRKKGFLQTKRDSAEPGRTF